MPLFVHDTLTREKRAFTPRDPGRVTLYVCGPTVYNYAHIGNARPVVVFDVLYRLLRRLYGAEHVVYARNFTDVDDRINAQAMEAGVPIGEITARFETAYLEDMSALGALPPTLQPRATENIDAMVDQIGRLVDAGSAYVADGHVLFRVGAFSDYGALSGRSVEDMIAGARVEVADYKAAPADFVLWKPSKPGEPAWPSPWGEGRPGWHIECSAMIERHLGLPIDIHGGGHDLIFPHHENEIAQGRCATHGGPYANYWMHNGFLTMDAEKMSKSVGNVALVHDLVKTWPGEALRWALLSAHYRAPLDWTDTLLEQSRKSLDRLYGVLQRAEDVPLVHDIGRQNPELNLGSLLADLNTPMQMSQLFEAARNLDQAIAGGDLERATYWKSALRDAGNVLGFLEADPEAWFSGGADDDLKAKVDALILARGEARRAKDWPGADRIRAELNALGVVVMDGEAGAATWRMRE